MFIELAEFLRCPACRDEGTPLVVVPDTMRDRMVRSGRLGCSGCRREFDIRDGVVRFGEPPGDTDAAHGLPDAASVEGIRTLLGLSGPGGYALLVGEAARLGGALAGVLPGVHWVAVNPPPDVRGTSTLSVVHAATGIPLRSATVRGAVVGHDYARPEWLGDGARAVLRGLRIVVFGEPTPVDGVEPLASSAGVWVGERR